MKQEDMKSLASIAKLLLAGIVVTVLLIIGANWIS